MARRDPHSYADLDQGVVDHIHLDLYVNFSERSVHGGVRLQLREPAAGILDLDTRALRIGACRDGGGGEVAYEVGEPDRVLGSRLRLHLPQQTQAIEIDFQTTSGSTALDWLAPEQTAGRAAPYLYSQCQPHHARSVFPCQDTPAARFRYSAAVTVPGGLNAVMAAAPCGSFAGRVEGTRTFTFEMPQPVPSYLTALAVGRISALDLSSRVRIYAEPEVLDQAAWEFAGVERMVEVAEEIFGPYEWERFDMLVMPFSFPFGGMENPRLTFLTPTLLAGDRSLVNVVAHELAHSWTGNLVTNASMEDFWINEGFTVWAERRILEALEGEEYAALHAAIGRISLEEAFERFGAESPYTRLNTPLEGVDPDEVYSEIPYEKGFLLVRLMEQVAGRERWDGALRVYMDRYRFTSITSEELLGFLDRELPGLTEAAKAREWIYEPGLPDNAPAFTSPRLEAVRALAEGWKGGERPGRDDVAAWSPEEWQLYLKWLPQTIDLAGCRYLDETFGLSASGNSEILVSWLVLAVRSGYDPALEGTRRVLTTVGRQKFLRPLYQALLSREQYRPLAHELFASMRARYHTLSRVAVEDLLKEC
ncbi:MAG: M1 family metallopeptidase [Acidobacteria bacterium]|nr:M1 family metallopeptidase [Acidobacteriota bacterium]